MPKYCTQIFVILLLLSGIVAAQQAVPSTTPPADATQATTTMQPFTSSDGRFSVLMPGSPKQESEQIAHKDGGSWTLYEFTVSLENDYVVYMITYSDYDCAIGDPQTCLAQVRDGAVSGKTLTSDVAIDLNGVPGRAYTVTDKDGWNYTIHSLLSGKRLYQLIVTSSKDHPATLTEQFLNSFRIF